jgi:hypothetical protein
MHPSWLIPASNYYSPMLFTLPAHLPGHRADIKQTAAVLPGREGSCPRTFKLFFLTHYSLGGRRTARGKYQVEEGGQGEEGGRTRSGTPGVMLKRSSGDEEDGCE